MNYLLLMYHTNTYWQDRTSERDEEEERAFTEFCTWMRNNGIEWQSSALTPRQEGETRRFKTANATAGMLPEVSDVITGFFVLDIPSQVNPQDVLDRCPHIQGTQLELRSIAND